VTNFDILKRLSNLEKEVFGSKLDDDAQNSKISEHAKATLNNAAQKVFEDNDDLDATKRF
jgi:cell division septum initiation protein DivIVA